MFTIDELLQPTTLSEAALLLEKTPDAVILGGCGFLKLGARHIRTAMDLSHCGLAEIVDHTEIIQIGAMATLYDIESNETLRGCFNGVLPRAVANILGTQFRRCATIGASVYSKYGFSDILPVLLVLNTEVELLKSGRMPLQVFLDKPIARDVLTHVYIHKDSRNASYQNLRNASADFPILNAAVSCFQEKWTIVVGARPAKAQIATNASNQLSNMPIMASDSANIAEIAAQELTFGKNNKATAEYRREISKILVKRAIEEVLACK